MHYITDSMTLFTLTIVKPVIILTFVLASVRYLKHCSASMQYFCLAAGVFSLLLLPAAVFFLPAIDVAILPAFIASEPYGNLATHAGNKLNPFVPGADSLALSWREFAFAIYFTGVLWVLFYVVIGLTQIYRQTRAGQVMMDGASISLLRQLTRRLNIRRPVKLVTCPALQSPQVWGVWHPTIMLPTNFKHWKITRQRRVLLHELAHIHRWDWLFLLLAKVVCSVFWFLPLIWIAIKKLQMMAELACDDHVIAIEGQSVAYAEDLLDIVKQVYRHPNQDMLLSIANGSPVYQRIRSILDATKNRDPVSMKRKLVIVIVGLVLILPLSSLQARTIKQQITFIQQKVGNLIPFSTISLPRSANENNKGSDHNQPSPINVLKQMKSALMPKAIPPVMEQVVVLAYMNNPLEDNEKHDSLVTRSYPLLHITKPEPHISIEGYIPLITVTPNYPNKAIERGIEGKVIVQFGISSQGEVENPTIVVSQPARVFDQAVLRALKQFRFKPQVMNGQPVPIVGVTERFVFQLSEGSRTKRRRSSFSGNRTLAQSH